MSTASTPLTVGLLAGGSNASRSSWFVRVYNASLSKNQDYDAYPGFTEVRSVAYDGSHDLFAIGDPCSASGYCSGYSSVGPPGLYEMTASAFTLSELTVKGVKLGNPAALAWVNPALLVDDSGFRKNDPVVGIKLLVGNGEATVKGIIPFAGTAYGQGIAFRAGVVSVTDGEDAVRSYSVSNGSFLSTLREKKAAPLAVTISQK